MAIHTTEHRLVLERKTLTSDPTKTRASLEDPTERKMGWLRRTDTVLGPAMRSVQQSSSQTKSGGWQGRSGVGEWESDVSGYSFSLAS